MKASNPKTGQAGLPPISALLELDSDEEIAVRFSFQDMAMWPFLRRWVIDTVLKLQLSPQLSPPEPAPLTVWQSAQYRYHRRFHSPWSVHRPFPYLFIGTGVANVLRQGRFYHRVADPFAFEFPEQTLLMEGSVRSIFRRPRHNPNVCYLDRIDYEVIKRAQNTRLASSDERAIHLLCSRLARQFPMLERFFTTNVRDVLQSHARTLPFYYESLHKLWDVIQPKLLMMEDASYGHRAYLLYWASKRMVTAECQHGAVSSQHAAYNHAENMRPEYRAYLPQYFLTYGQFWNEQIRSASQLVTIGNPWLTMAVEEAGEPSASEILIVSNALHTDQGIEYALHLQHTFPGKTLRFRPHPSEQAIANVRYERLLSSGIRLDEAPLYSSISRSEFVVGAFSTVLYEAMAFKKKIVMTEDAFSHMHAMPGVFCAVSTKQELAEAIAHFPGNPILDSHYLWASNWQKNYRNFLGRLFG